MQLISGKFHRITPFSEDLISWVVGLESDKATSRALHLLSQHWGFKMHPVERGDRNEKQDAHVHLKSWHAFLLRKQLSFFTALHLPAQKRVEELTPPDFNQFINASGRPSENRSETSGVHEER